MRTHHTFVDLLIRSVMAVLLGIGLALLLNTKSVAGDVTLDVIKTRTDLYQKVTVTGHNETDIFINHSRGMANVKIKDLDEETLWRVGLGPEPGSPEAIAAAEAAANKGKMPAALAKMFDSASAAASAATSPAVPAMESDTQQQILGMTGGGQHPFPIQQLDPKLLIIVGAIFLAIHLFFSFCLKLIVQKTGHEPGLMVWLPFFQIFPMLRAAGMSGWWVLGMFVPILNIVVQILWCVKIVQARGKSVWVTIFLIVPFTNLFAFLYLAFSNGAHADEDASDEEGKIVIQSTFSEA